MTSTPVPTFAELGLPAVLVQALRRDGIETPFPIQAATIADALAGKDVLGRGPTGSGKTLAFGLPMLARLTGSAAKPLRPRGLVLAPTRELVLQIERALDEPALALGLRVAAVVGGAPIKRQADRLNRGVDLLIATPGRLADLLTQGAADLSEVRITALDEADHMADMGFLPQVTKLLDRTPKDGQRLLFSATLDGEVDKLVKRYLRDPVTHSTAPAAASVTTMSHHLLYLHKADKRAVTAEIAARDGLTIMFVRTKYGADRLAKQLRAAGISAGALHGGKAQNNRTRTLAAFAEGVTPVLVTTDVAARGIHVDGISLVVHVDPPAEPKAYLHRAGRTARAGEEGVVVTLVTDEERGDVEKMTRKAGVDIEGIAVRPGDRKLVEITGARRPSGIAVAAAAAPAEPTHTVGAPKKSRRRVSERTAGTAVVRDPAARGTARAGRTARETTPSGPTRATGGARSAAGGPRGAGETNRSGTAARTTDAPKTGRAVGGSAGRGGAAGKAARSGGFGANHATRGDTPGRGRRRAGAPAHRNRGAN
ncbi:MULTISPECIES: DEAD/DEAH box helicase [unclassified Nocardia]|uniref:DEAD/DEAH box helicase n=1 Tax=unclassified Nocardia TaxID=2637762 RepID=UPI001CE44385|nr:MULTISPECIES: DEAD/DEAH box helicase [unclassified Nocardia]